MPAGGLIAAGIGSVIAAGKNSSAQSNAANIQGQTSQEALALQKQIYDKNLAMRQPYYNQGVTSLGALGQQAASGTVVPLPGPVIGGRSTGTSGAPAFNPTTQANSVAANTPQTAANNPLGNYANADPMVLVQAPDGEQRQLPTSVAQKLTAKGGFSIVPFNQTTGPSAGMDMRSGS